MLGKQAGDERLYLKREDKESALKSMQNVYKETRLQVAYYISQQENRQLQAAWRRETLKVENAVVTVAQTTMEEVGMRLKFNVNTIQLDGEQIKQEWKLTWKG